jgi:hypothetical protein
MSQMSPIVEPEQAGADRVGVHPALMGYIRARTAL